MAEESGKQEIWHRFQTAFTGSVKGNFNHSNSCSICFQSAVLNLSNEGTAIGQNNPPCNIVCLKFLCYHTYVVALVVYHTPVSYLLISYLYPPTKAPTSFLLFAKGHPSNDAPIFMLQIMGQFFVFLFMWIFLVPILLLYEWWVDRHNKKDL